MITDPLAGFFAPWGVFAGILVLHLVLPARRVAGYARDERSGDVLRYRLNGGTGTPRRSFRWSSPNRKASWLAVGWPRTNPS